MIQEIKDNIFSVGASDPERRLFDTLIPLPFGTSYNSYLVKGKEKTALIDTVDPTKSDVLLKNLEEAGISKIDYVIINHAEQDHSGTLPLVLEKFPEAKVVCSEKCLPMIIDLLHIHEDRCQVVKDGETLDLGGKTLEFILTPWVHWPETMVTLLREDKLLFSCDFFGSHLATDDLFKFEKEHSFKATKIYFAEIMMPFRTMIKNNIAKLENYEIEMIAPSHGPIQSEAKIIMDYYRTWIADDGFKNTAVLAYVSMHGSTKILADRLKDALVNQGVEVRLYNISSLDLGEIASDLVDAATVVVGTPCVLGGIHPGAASLLYLANALRPKTKFVSVIGSYGWSGGIVEAIVPMIKNLKAEVVPPVVVKGKPREVDLLAIDELAKAIAEKHKGMGLI